MTEAVSSLPRSPRHLRDVRSAVEHAVNAAFNGRTKDQAIATVEDVLRKVAYPGKYGDPSDNDLRQAALFFDEIVRQLDILISDKYL
jgi:hypothetical protein